MMEAQLILASWFHKLRFELRDASEPAVEALLTLRPRAGIPMRVRPRHSRTQSCALQASGLAP
jgi:cytochrome P450